MELLNGAAVREHLQKNADLSLNILRKCGIERFADFYHGERSGWIKEMLGETASNSDGSITISKEQLDMWENRMNTPYQDITEDEKESSKSQAAKIIDIVEEVLGDFAKSEEKRINDEIIAMNNLAKLKRPMLHKNNKKWAKREFIFVELISLTVPAAFQKFLGLQSALGTQNSIKLTAIFSSFFALFFGAGFGVAYLARKNDINTMPADKVISQSNAIEMKEQKKNKKMKPDEIA